VHEDGLLSSGDESLWTLDVAGIVEALRSALGECELSCAEEHPLRKNILTLVSAVTDAGIDGEAFVRYGCTLDIAVPLAVALALDAVIDELSPEGRRWIEALGVSSVIAAAGPAGARGAVGEVATALLPTLCRWVHFAPFSDVVTLTPPSPETRQLIAESPDAPDDDLSADYKWVADRLGGGDLATWAPTSLSREYRWRRGNQYPNLPDAVLIDIAFSVESLAVELADRHLLAGQPMSPVPSVAYQVEKRAKEFLRSDRFSEAAALFEFMCEQKWLPEALCLNDRGFCLIPAEPRRALRFLERSASLGYAPLSVNIYNQMCCKLALGDGAGVVALAEYFWSEQFEEQPMGASLWVREEDKWVLKKTPDSREFIADLAITVAQQEGWADRAERWQMRLDALRNGQYFR
jgi:hypothetical protein